MESALHVSTTVLRGNTIEISAPGLKEGELVDVFVFPAESGHSLHCSVLEIIDSLKGHRLFPTVEEVDRFLRQEREAWVRSEC
jgi:hypothetical protein